MAEFPVNEQDMQANLGLMDEGKLEREEGYRFVLTERQNFKVVCSHKSCTFQAAKHKVVRYVPARNRLNVKYDVIVASD